MTETVRFFVKINKNHLEIIATPSGITAKQHQKTLKMSSANSQETSDEQQKKQRNTRESKKTIEQLLQTMKHFSKFTENFEEVARTRKV